MSFFKILTGRAGDAEKKAIVEPASLIAPPSIAPPPWADAWDEVERIHPAWERVIKQCKPAISADPPTTILQRYYCPGCGEREDLDTPMGADGEPMVPWHEHERGPVMLMRVKGEPGAPVGSLQVYAQRKQAALEAAQEW